MKKKKFKAERLYHNYADLKKCSHQLLTQSRPPSSQLLTVLPALDREIATLGVQPRIGFLPQRSPLPPLLSLLQKNSFLSSTNIRGASGKCS